MQWYKTKCRNVPDAHNAAWLINSLSSFNQCTCADQVIILSSHVRAFCFFLLCDYVRTCSGLWQWYFGKVLSSHITGEFACHFPFYSVYSVSSSFDMKHLLLQLLLFEPLHPGINTKTTCEVVDSDSGQLQVQTRGSFVSPCSGSGQILTESKWPS